MQDLHAPIGERLLKSRIILITKYLHFFKYYDAETLNGVIRLFDKQNILNKANVIVGRMAVSEWISMQLS